MSSCGDNFCGDLSKVLGQATPASLTTQLQSQYTNNNDDNNQQSGDGFVDTENQITSTAKEEATDVESGSDNDADRGGILASVFLISGCEDSQTSADVSNVSNFSLPDPNGKAGGACTSALLKVLYADQTASQQMSFVQVLNAMRTILAQQQYSQTPQLSSSQQFNVEQDFYLVPPNCQGTKRAVLIGINYVGQSGELSGCINDCLNMKDYIMNVWGFEEQNITVLVDDGSHTKPTRSNILSAYKAVANASKSGDAVFCHYSGHGGRVRDDDAEEADGYDETLVPVDYNSAGQIHDDDLYKTLVCAMPEGVYLVALMDCCHSGSVLDLPYKFKAGSSGGMTYEPGNGSGVGGSMTMLGVKKSATCICIAVGILGAAMVLAIVLPIFFG